MHFIQHCFICRPSDSTVSENARIEPRTVATSSLAVRRSNHPATSHIPDSDTSHPHSATSHPQFIYTVYKSVVLVGRGRGGCGEEPDEPGEGGGEEEDPGAGGGQEEGGGGGGGGRALPLQVFQQDHQDHR
jgi:hypothetical protein